MWLKSKDKAWREYSLDKPIIVKRGWCFGIDLETEKAYFYNSKGRLVKTVKLKRER